MQAGEMRVADLDGYGILVGQLEWVAPAAGSNHRRETVKEMGRLDARSTLCAGNPSWESGFCSRGETVTSGEGHGAARHGLDRVIAGWLIGMLPIRGTPMSGS